MIRGSSRQEERRGEEAGVYDSEVRAGSVLPGAMLSTLVLTVAALRMKEVMESHFYVSYPFLQQQKKLTMRALSIPCGPPSDVLV